MSATQRDAYDDDGSPDSGASPSRPLSGPRQTIVAFPDGPLLVRGDFDIVDPDGKPLRRSRKTVALCRCGASVLKPYCDGSHKLIGFKTEPES
ncbi:CDGSH iron-sulfur domain-containing protein [Arthrobacter sp. H5]|uniref:CDGSH iron-sulfur domain-containing protein n=1 Tax=Arthrobacter sp. H5 TaxID=1267973 RepID=UPI0004872F72|nr:CDGSH iron-sulfur domain-containing protein [Arthrobacter sp. H5]